MPGKLFSAYSRFRGDGSTKTLLQRGLLLSGTIMGAIYTTREFVVHVVMVSVCLIRLQSLHDLSPDGLG